jgi:putative acetyltransferase
MGRAGNDESGTLSIHAVTDASELPIVRHLFEEYADSLGFSLEAQNFTLELDALPGAYAPPRGGILLATVDGEPAGCVALRPIGDNVCEMKRLYVRPAYRGLGLGRLLAGRIVDAAREAGYEGMVLDTIPAQMRPAVALYEALGFEPCEPYWDNPLPGVGYMRLVLARG